METKTCLLVVVVTADSLLIILKMKEHLKMLFSLKKIARMCFLVKIYVNHHWRQWTLMLTGTWIFLLDHIMMISFITKMRVVLM